MFREQVIDPSVGCWAHLDLRLSTQHYMMFDRDACLSDHVRMEMQDLIPIEPTPYRCAFCGKDVTPEDSIPTFWTQQTEWDAPCCMSCVQMQMTFDVDTYTYELKQGQTVPESAVPLSDLI